MVTKKFVFATVSDSESLLARIRSVEGVVSASIEELSDGQSVLTFTVTDDYGLRSVPDGTIITDPSQLVDGSTDENVQQLAPLVIIAVVGAVVIASAGAFGYFSTDMLSSNLTIVAIAGVGLLLLFIGLK